MFCLCSNYTLIGEAMDMVKAVSGPKYDGKYLHKIVKEILGDIRLSDTLTNVIIPTFDIKRLQPMVFSSYEVCFHIFKYIDMCVCVCMFVLLNLI